MFGFCEIVIQFISFLCLDFCWIWFPSYFPDVWIVCVFRVGVVCLGKEGIWFHSVCCCNHEVWCFLEGYAFKFGFLTNFIFHLVLSFVLYMIFKVGPCCIFNCFWVVKFVDWMERNCLSHVSVWVLVCFCLFYWFSGFWICRQFGLFN